MVALRVEVAPISNNTALSNPALFSESTSGIISDHLNYLNDLTANIAHSYLQNLKTFFNHYSDYHSEKLEKSLSENRHFTTLQSKNITVINRTIISNTTDSLPPNTNTEDSEGFIPSNFNEIRRGIAIFLSATLITTATISWRKDIYRSLHREFCGSPPRYQPPPMQASV
jgi:hypothetical protein